MENGNPERKTNWTPPSPTEKKPIICPVCGNVHLAFVTEYHKAIFLRIIRLILTLFTLVLFCSDCYTALIKHEQSSFESLSVVLIILIIAITILSCFVIAIESKTHVQAICKDCGNLWLLN